MSTYIILFLLHINGDIKRCLNFCNGAIFYDYKNIGFIGELNQARRCVINNFHETIPVTRILNTLCIIVVVILKSHDNDIEKVIENIHDLRANTLYMIGLEKVVKDAVDNLMN